LKEGQGSFEKTKVEAKG